jgi:hypothetical protein
VQLLTVVLEALAPDGTYATLSSLQFASLAEPSKAVQPAPADRKTSKQPLTLNVVLAKLTSGGGGTGSVPYRDSSLTHLLAPSLGGSSVCVAFCMASPAVQRREETRRSLQMAQRFKRVVNHTRGR